MKGKKFVAESMSGRVAKIEGAEFCFGIGTNLAEAERSLKHQKELRRHRSERSLGSMVNGSDR